MVAHEPDEKRRGEKVDDEKGLVPLPTELRQGKDAEDGQRGEGLISGRVVLVRRPCVGPRRLSQCPDLKTDGMNEAQNDCSVFSGT
jgi:hypothetical protein